MTFASIALPTRATPRRFALIVAVAFAITALGLLVAPRAADAWSSGQYDSTSERQLVALTNQSRAAAGLRSLKVDSTLTSIARGRSKDMIVRGYFSHSIPPSGKNVFSILDSKGYCYAIAGENIGWNNYPDNTATKTVHRMFMESPGHRSNVLGKRWDVIGIGAYKGPTGKKMWTVLFADKCGGSSGGGGGATAPKATPKPTPKATPKPTPIPTPVRTMPPEPTPVVTPMATAKATLAPSSTPAVSVHHEAAGSGDGDGSGPRQGRLTRMFSYRITIAEIGGLIMAVMILLTLWGLPPSR